MIVARFVDRQNQHSSALSISCISSESSIDKHELIRQLTIRLWYRFIAWHRNHQLIIINSFVSWQFDCHFNLLHDIEIISWQSSIHSLTDHSIAILIYCMTLNSQLIIIISFRQRTIRFRFEYSFCSHVIFSHKLLIQCWQWSWTCHSTLIFIISSIHSLLLILYISYFM